VSDCGSFEPTLSAYVAGEIDETELGPLLAHCRSCESCRRVLELHRDLSDLGARADRPDESAFAAMRARVLDEAGARRRAGRGLAWWRSPVQLPLRAAALTAAAGLVFVLGVFSDRLLTERVAPAEGNGTTQRLLSAMSAEAASNRTLGDVEDSRFTYSNVTLRRLGEGRVSLDFDVTTHVRLVEPERSELVQDVLVQSLLNPTSTGTRLKAISYAAEALEPKIKEALVFAMRRDENLAVRLKALSILKDAPPDQEIEAALLETLREDPAVQMRLEALDCLATRQVDPELLRRVVEEQPSETDAALLVRLARYGT
jgi:hypothetical protein